VPKPLAEGVYEHLVTEGIEHAWRQPELPRALRVVILRDVDTDKDYDHERDPEPASSLAPSLKKNALNP